MSGSSALAGTGDYEIDHSVTFDANMVTTKEKDLVKTIEVEAETAIIIVIDSRLCPYSSGDIKGYREASGIVNFILKDLGDRKYDYYEYIEGVYFSFYGLLKFINERF